MSTNNKPKSRQVHFVRPQATPVADEPIQPEEIAGDDRSLKTPPGTRLRIMKMVMEEQIPSTTTMAQILNDEDVQSASGKPWTAANVDSMLRTLDLKEEHRRLTQPEPMPDHEVTPTPTFDYLLLRQTVDDSVKLAVVQALPGIVPDLVARLAADMQEKIKVTTGPAPIVQIDHTKVATEITGRLTTEVVSAISKFLSRHEQTIAEHERDLVAGVKTSVETAIKASPLTNLKEVLNRAAENAYETRKRVDDEMSKISSIISDSTMAAAGLLDEKVEKRLNTFEVAALARLQSMEATIRGQLQGSIELDIDATLTKIVDERLKKSHDETLNRVAVMFDALKRDITTTITARLPIPQNVLAPKSQMVPRPR